MAQPLVSVIISAYNLGWCIEDTVRSVLAQTYRNIEVIVVDDASTDDTAQRMRALEGKVTYLRHPKNLGTTLRADGGPARNTALKVAKGEYLAFLDGDDAWEPEKIAEQVRAAQQFPDAGLIVAEGIIFAHEDGSTVRTTLLHDFGDVRCSAIPPGAVQSLDLYPALLLGCVIDTPSQVMVPAKVVREVGPFALLRGDDYEFYLRVSRRYETAIIKKPLVRYRYHTTSVSGAMDRQLFRFAQPNICIWRKHLKECRPGVEPQLRQHMVKFTKAVTKQALEIGRRGDRAWARGFLGGFLWSNLGRPGSLGIARAWLKLCMPAWLSRKARGRQPQPV